jgi:hypothetical protein
MAMLLLVNGNAKKVPECEKCGTYMIPVDLECCDQWKFPNCKEDKLINSEWLYQQQKQISNEYRKLSDDYRLRIQELENEIEELKKNNLNAKDGE